jgi:heme oxygenase (biliverdin-IX-beta and delta-forming)
VSRLRAATGEIHRRIEARLDIVARLADPSSRHEMIRRFATLYLPADAALEGFLAGVPGLGAGRPQARMLSQPARCVLLPPFPAPESRAEALGMLYVLEGSMLGGRVILKALARKGVNDPALAFLNPYAAETGARWQSLLAVLEREASDDEARIAAICTGARRAFQHAERILCEDMP